MAQQLVNVGTANARDGDELRAAFIKLNANDTELFASSIPSFVTITDPASFPVQDATTITLESKFIYVLVADVTVNKNFIVEDGAVITGFNINGYLLTYTGSGVMFTGVDASFNIRDLAVTCPSAQIFSFNDQVGGVKRFFCQDVELGNSTKVGTFTDMNTVEFTNSGTLDADDGITMAGTSGVVLSIGRLGLLSTSATFVGVDFGASALIIMEITNLVVIGVPGGIALSGLAASGNVPVGREFMVTNSEFIGVTDLAGIQSDDIRWTFQSNSPTADSRNAGDIYLSNEGLAGETITVSGSGEWYEIGVPAVVGSVWASDVLSRFTMSTGGVLTYIGEPPIEVTMIGRTTVEKVGGGADALEARLALNWNGLVTDSGIFKSRGLTQNTTPTTVPVGALIEMSNGDNVRMIYSNTTGSANIVADVSSIVISE